MVTLQAMAKADPMAFNTEEEETKVSLEKLQLEKNFHFC